MRKIIAMLLVLSGTIVGGFMCSILGVQSFIAEEDMELSSIIYGQMGSVQSVKMDTPSLPGSHLPCRCRDSAPLAAEYPVLRRKRGRDPEC